MAKKVRLDVTYGADTVCVLRHGRRSAGVPLPRNRPAGGGASRPPRSSPAGGRRRCHQPMAPPLGETGESISRWAEQHFNSARRWYRFTIDELYSRSLEVEARGKAVYEGLGKGSTQADVTRGLNGPSASPNGEGSSAEPT